MVGSVAISGGGGLVGSALVASLVADGWRVVRLVRSTATAADQVAWNPADGSIDGAGLEGLDAFVHLAGENIAARRWSVAQKKRIRDSRVEGTALVARTLAGLSRPPRTLVCASAVGYYGSRGDELLVESSVPGRGFLAGTCLAWEAASEPATRAGIRVVKLRIGVVLASGGGALPRMLIPFRFGLGGRLGDGRQYVSWVALEDLVGIVRYALDQATLEGPVNAVAPQAVRNAELTAELGRLLRRPTLFPLPAPVVGLLLGEMGRELLLSSTRVEPRRLLDAGFDFRLARLEPALRQILQR